MSSAQLDIARVIGLERQAEARASAQSATARQARRERRLSHRRARVAARSNG